MIAEPDNEIYRKSKSEKEKLGNYRDKSAGKGKEREMEKQSLNFINRAYGDMETAVTSRDLSRRVCVEKTW